jgi:prespore-specific regulator
MSTTRQDAWTQDEDMLLAEVVLRHIREGGTQLQAFEEVGQKLSRTAAACGFRWNSTIRKQYKTGIELAKKQRKEGKKHSTQSPVQQGENYNVETHLHYNLEKTEGIGQTNREPSFEDLLVYLNKLYDRSQDTKKYEEDMTNYQEKALRLEQKLQELAAENMKLKKELYSMEHDYKALIEIMERARKMVVLKDEEFAQKVRFQMDKNGNLEKLDK